MDDPNAPEETVIDTAPQSASRPAVPRVNTIDQMLALANGGEFKDDLPKMLSDFVGGLFSHAVEYEIDASGKFTLAITATVDRRGDIEFTAKPKIELPPPVLSVGKGRAFIDEDGQIVTHRQQDLPLLRDVSKPKRTLRDRAK